MSPVLRTRRATSDRSGPRFPPGYWTIWTTVAIDLVGFGIVAPILPLYAKRFGASGFTAGLLFSTFSLAQFLFAPVLGRLSDRYGRKPIIVLSLFGTAVGSFLTAAAGSLAVLFFARALDGASGASVSVAQGAVSDLASPEDRPRLLGMLGAAFGVGFVIGPAIGGLASVHPTLPFTLAGIIAALNGIAALVRLPETRPSAARAGGASRAAAATGHRLAGLLDAARHGRMLRRLLLVTFAATCSFSGFEATFSRFGDARFGLTLASASAVFVGIGVFLVAVQGGLIGPVTKALGNRRAYTVGLGLSAAGLLTLAAAQSWWVLVPALALLALGQGIATPTLTSMVVDRVPPDQRGQALGFQQSAGALARIAGPALAGKLFDIRVPLPYLVGAGLTLAALALLLGDGEKDRTASGVSASAAPTPAPR